MYNIDTQEQVEYHLCGFDGIRGGNYFGGEEPIGRIEVEVRVGKLKDGKTARKDEINGEMKKGGGDTFKSGVVPEEWRSAVTIPLSKGKGERTDYKNYRGISLLSGDLNR